MAGTFHPTSELVVCAWIGSIPGFPLSASGANKGIATQAPNQENWPNIDGISQFITCRTVGGNPRPWGQAPLAMPVMEIRSWATRLSSNKPAWFVANELLELIRLACYERSPSSGFGRLLTPQANNVTYNGARVMSTMIHMEPRRIYNDPRNYGTYSMDVGFTWCEVGLTLA